MDHPGTEIVLTLPADTSQPKSPGNPAYGQTLSAAGKRVAVSTERTGVERRQEVPGRADPVQRVPGEDLGCTVSGVLCQAGNVTYSMTHGYAGQPAFCTSRGCSVARGPATTRPPPRVHPTVKLIYQRRNRVRYERTELYQMQPAEIGL